MEAFAAIYLGTLSAGVTLAFLILLQFVVVDVSLIRARHVPGMPVAGGHDSFLFRAVRAYGNTTENLGQFLLLIGCALLLGTDPRWTAIAAWTFVAGRAGHMLCYYADWRTLRSVAFGIGALAVLGLFVLSVMALCRLLP